MGVLDIIVLCLIGLLVFNGIRKGFIISLASLVELGLGIFAAVYFSNYIEKILSDNLHPSGSWLPILSFALTFLVVVIIVMLIGKALEKMVDLVGMGILNHIFGGIFGLLKGVLFVSVLLFVITAMDPKEKLITRKVKQESLVYRYVSKAFPYMIKVSGGEIRFSYYELQNTK
jgi:membrane protein required for colicin V production